MSTSAQEIVNISWVNFLQILCLIGTTQSSRQRRNVDTRKGPQNVGRKHDAMHRNAALKEYEKDKS